MPITKPQLKTAHEHGVLAGRFTIILGSYTSLFAQDSKQLAVVLTVEPDHAWFVRFEVRERDTVTSFRSLAAAARAYNVIEAKGARR